MGALSGLTVGLMKGAGNVAKGKGFMEGQFGAGTTPDFKAPGSGPVTAAQSGAAINDPIVTVGKDGLIDIQPITGKVTTMTSPGYDPTTFAKTVADKQGAFSYLKPSNIAKNLGIGGGPSTPAGITSVGGGATDPSFLSKVGEGFTKSIVEDPIGKGTQLVGTGLITAGLLTGEEEEGDGRNLVDYEPYEAEGGVFEGLGYNPETGRFENVRVIRPTDFERAAAGGEISGPGTGTSDSIPAMLSDGEFVMTAKAVRGMGDGSRKKGGEMYQMMNKLESMA